MLGLFKRKAEDQLSPRLKAAAEVRAHLQIAAAIFTHVLDELSINCAQLAEEPTPPNLTLARSMFEATQYFDNGKLMDLRLGLTDDRETYSLEPHYRYREICWLVDDLASAKALDRDRYEKLSQKHAPHALIQARLLSVFLLRVPAVDDLVRAGDMNEIEQELQFSAEAIVGLTAQLPAPLVRDLDIEAMRKEWLGWPEVFGVPATE